MFSFVGCVVKLLISIAVASSMWDGKNIAVCILMGVMTYSVISGWWYCCQATGNYLVGTGAFLAVVFACSLGAAESSNKVINIISYMGIFAIAAGGAVADIWGLIQEIRYR